MRRGSTTMKNYVLYFLIVIFFNSCAFIIDNNTYRYYSFPCKNEVFTNKQPLRLHRWKASSQYELEIDGKYSQENTTTLKTYPIGSQFTFQKLYTHYAFGIGDINEFIVEAEDGVKALLNARDVNVNECGLDYFYEDSRLVLSGEKQKVTSKKEAHKNPVIKPYIQNDDYLYIKSHFANDDTASDCPTLTLILPNEKYYHFTKKIIEQHAPSINKFHTRLQANQGNDLPIFILNDYEFTPIKCNSDFSDMYDCFTTFELWLSAPYETHLPVEFSTPEEVRTLTSNLENNTTLIVGYLKTLEYMDYLRLLKGIDEIDTHFTAKKKIMLLAGDSGKFTLKRGFNIVDQHGKTIDTIYFISPYLIKKLEGYDLYDQ